jgi:site-specific recombinase XerD
MFEQLFSEPLALARYRAGPLLEDRLRYLAHRAQQGMTRHTLRATARYVLVVTEVLRLADRTGEDILPKEVAQQALLWSKQPGPAKVIGSRSARVEFVKYATHWLRFLGRLRVTPNEAGPDDETIAAFADHLRRDRELAPSSIHISCSAVRALLGWIRSAGSSLSEITASRLDEAFIALFGNRGYSTVSLRRFATNWRHFLRFAGQRGWCRTGLQSSIQAPRVFTQAALPCGPSWDEVRRVIAATEGDQPADVRDRAILLLLAVYGLRVGEVIRLRLDDFDWEREAFTVTRPKPARFQTFPLSHGVGDALIRYLKEVRPKTARREVFLTRCAPLRPVQRGTVYLIVSRKLRAVCPSLPRHGPHALRHACATHLLHEGLSMKEIADYLGHHDLDTTRIYAKVNLAGLREVADFDLGGLL